jgi:cytochrome c biogenesis protein CcdA/thiol-disulfide isomerase/thioredoxin
MFTLAILAFVSGLLTVLAPCVLPLLPIIIGSSVSDAKDKYKPYLVTLGLVISITLFTIILKASTLLIDIDPVIWKYISGGIVILFGLIYIFPHAWDWISFKFGLSSKSDKLLHTASQNQVGGNILGPLLIGASLGPVFASCSPTYSLIIATVLPVNFVEGIIYIIIYALGLASIMLAIALLGRQFIGKLKAFSNPNGIFKKVLGVIFLIVGISVISGFDKVVETNILNSGYFDVTKIEQQLLDNNKNKMHNSSNTTSNNNGSNSSNLNKSTSLSAPEIIGISEWINSSNPKGETLKDLKGKVVLVDFWTYSCINCQRTLPYVTKWYDTYKDKGFVVLGIHAPEFTFEQKKENVQKAVIDNKINYPVGLDNGFKTWNNYKNQFWPAHYLIDKEGNIRYTHFGEGKYSETEKQIQELLGEKNAPMVSESVSAKKGSPNQNLTPETYLGTDRRKGEAVTLTGKWENNPDNIKALETGATLNLKFNAKEVYIVAEGGNGSIQVSNQDGKSETIVIKESKLYTVYKADNFTENGNLQIVADKDVILNVFTFG